MSEKERNKADQSFITKEAIRLKKEKDKAKKGEKNGRK